jgi:putative FmdB family regulatory protein
MPAFDYVCDTCGRPAEQIRPWADRDRPVRCGAGGCKGSLVPAPGR